MAKAKKSAGAKAPVKTTKVAVAKAPAKTKKVVAVKAPAKAAAKTPAKAAAKAPAKVAAKAPAKAKSVAVKAPKTKSQILVALAERAEISRTQAKVVYESLLDIAYKGAKDKNGFVLPGLGKLIKVQRKARKGINPATKEAIKIPAKTVVKFRLAKACKESVLK